MKLTKRLIALLLAAATLLAIAVPAFATDEDALGRDVTGQCGWMPETVEDTPVPYLAQPEEPAEAAGPAPQGVVPRLTFSVPEKLRLGKTGLGVIVGYSENGFHNPCLTPDAFIMYGRNVQISEIERTGFDGFTASYQFLITGVSPGVTQLNIRSSVLVDRNGVYSAASTIRTVTVYPSYPTFFSERMVAFCDWMFETFCLLRF